MSSAAPTDFGAYAVLRDQGDGALAGHRPFTETIVFWKHTSEPISTRETSEATKLKTCIYTQKEDEMN
jgi:hypothetical protein